jgi:hypothetical protein
MALLRELQSAVDDAVRRGGAREAKDLTRFMHDVRRALAEIRQRIAEREHERAEALSDALTALPKDRPAPRLDARMQRLAEDAALGHAHARRRRLRARAERVAALLPSRTEMLVVGLAACAALWLVIVAAPRLAADPVPAVAVGDLPGGGIVLAIDARPPAAYVDVDAARWDGLDEAGRRTAIGGVTAVLLGKGYVGALFRTPEARPVALWLAGRGAELIAATEQVDADPRHAAMRVIEPGRR